jgi:branched-chain amino acid transport system permease protein
MLQALIVGLVQGGTYGLIAVGLVLVYKGSRVLNFAQAEIGTATLYIATILVTDRHLPYWVGALTSIAAALLVGLLFERLVVRRMTGASRLSIAVGTIGLFSLLLASELYFFGPSPHYLQPPIAGLGVQLAGVYVSPTQLLTFGIIAAVALGLAAFLRFTDFGLGVLAAAQDATAVRLVGVPLSRVSMFTWGTGAVLSALAALLIEPTITTITPGAIGEPLFIGGLAAALLGGLTSLPGAFAGGIVVGVVSTEVKFEVTGGPPGLSALVLFGIVLLVLLLRPQGLLGRLSTRAEMS